MISTQLVPLIVPLVALVTAVLLAVVTGQIGLTKQTERLLDMANKFPDGTPERQRLLDRAAANLDRLTRPRGHLARRLLWIFIVGYALIVIALVLTGANETAFIRWMTTLGTNVGTSVAEFRLAAQLGPTRGLIAYVVIAFVTWLWSFAIAWLIVRKAIAPWLAGKLYSQLHPAKEGVASLPQPHAAAPPVVNSSGAPAPPATAAGPASPPAGDTDPPGPGAPSAPSG